MRIKREKIFTGSPWESTVGYCRAIKIGDKIEIAGTTAMKDGKVVGVGSPYDQTKFIIERIKEALAELGADLSDVVRTRMFVTDISKWEEIGQAHGEFFHAVQPVSTMVEVKSLIHPQLLIEIEAEAIIDNKIC